MSGLSSIGSIQISEEQVSCEVAGMAVILHTRSGNYFSLNEVGARIWELLQQGQSMGSIFNILQEDYEVSQQQCEQDLVKLVMDLKDQGFVNVQLSTAEA
ncbi:MAG: PqqD family protein [Cyanophyceae cyanobacterium]